MNMKTLLSSFLAVACGSASALDRRVAMTYSKFDSLTIEQIRPERLIYTDNSKEGITDFATWQKNHPLEGRILALYPGYQPPKIRTLVDNVPTELVEDLMIWETRSVTLLNISPAKIKLSKMIDMDKISELDQEIKHREISPDQFMQNEIGSGKPITNWSWCNSDKEYIVRPQKELDLSYLKAHKYCTNSARQRCVESCFIFDAFWQEGVKAGLALNMTKAAAANGKKLIQNGVTHVTNLITGKNEPTKPMVEAEKKDFGVAIQSEVRYYVSEEEYGANLKEITHFNTPVRGVIEQNMFYFNQVFQYGKLVAVLQEHPTDSSKTILTAFAVMGVRKRSWDKYSFVLPDVMSGGNIFNSDKSLTAGIPIFTQNVAKKIANLLEQP